MQKLLRLKFLLVLALSSFTFISCSKDDDASPSGDGSKFIGEWAVTEIYKDGKNILPSEPIMGKGSESSLSFTKSGDFASNLDIVYLGESVTLIYWGAWDLTSSNIIDINGEYDLKISKITETQLEYEFEDDEYGMLEVRSVRVE